MRKDLRDIQVEENVWYEEARTSRAGWKGMCCAGLESCRENQSAQTSTIVRDVLCEVYKKRHECLSERRKPVSQQQGAMQCRQRRRWFRSKGGFAVHRYTPTN